MGEFVSTAVVRAEKNIDHAPRSQKVALGYMPQLDGLRAIAVVLVIVHHAMPFEFGGWLGVNVFFVLSGYLITSLLRVERERHGRVNLKRFYLRRLLRLYPPLLTAMIVLFPLGVATIGAVKYFGHNVIAAAYLANIHTTLTGRGLPWWTHTWTLALEEQFYLVWPVLFVAAFAGVVAHRRLRRRTTVTVVALTVVGFASLVGGVIAFNTHGYNVNPVFSVGGLVLGCVLALTKETWVRAAEHWSVGISGVAVLIVAVALGSAEPTLRFAPITATVGSMLLIPHLVAAAQGRGSRALSVPPLVYIGRISYELYLWHYPLLAFLGMLYPNRPREIIVAAVVGSFAASALSHRFVSGPLNRRFKPHLV